MPISKFRRIHLYTFRLVLATSIFLLGSIEPFSTSLQRLGPYKWLQIGLCCEIFTHHVCSLFPVIALPNLFDLILVLGELSVWFILLGKFHRAFAFDPWAPQSYSIYLLSMVYRLAGRERRDLFAQYEFGMPWSLVLFGEALFRKRYPNEPCVTRGIRAVIAYVFICGLIVYSLFVLVVGPVQETAFPPVKTFRGSRLLDPQFKKLHHFWRVFTLLDSHTVQELNITGADLQSSINVTVFWDDNEGQTQSTCAPESQMLKHIDSNDLLSMRTDPLDFIKFNCPERYQLPTGNSTDNDRIRFYDNSNLAPDVLITINFTSLNIMTRSFANTRRQAISILVGLTDVDKDVISNTIPTPLFPGSHLLASVSREVRQISIPRFLASLGTFTFFRTFLTAQLTFVAPDPSPLINRQENTATLRIYTQNDPSDWTLKQDYREHYALDGLSNIGGFWAFVNGLFIVFFGSTLTMIIFGTKHFTIFGVVDRAARARLRETFENEYPKLREEVPPDQRGLLDLLRDHFIDLSVLDQRGSTTNTVLCGPLQARHARVRKIEKKNSSIKVNVTIGIM
ncbi:hypothetical protein BDZ94DRAFT_1299092 [Collybia nuda]|uniref:Uncharacterized protein n=1 Tax=Collybia nuda TaxID=64659 RepID=A0A9P5Y2Q7_9AGAR|nr:hypothetical protein BDZ94DRAFT_1299092 [Collybia nuda]